MEKLTERDLELLAWARAKAASPRKLRNLGLIGFALIFVGGLFFTSGKLYGLAGMSMGIIIIGITLVFNSRAMKKEHQVVKDFYYGKGILPPWPDEQ